jgi:ribosomal protein S12 methylthiotransferase accessory factor
MAVSGLAAAAAVRWLSEGQHPDLEGRVITVDVATGVTASHELMWRPQCPACGAPDASRDRLPDPVLLGPTRKVFVDDGGHRVVHPERTVARYGRHVSPVTGIISSLEPIGWPGTPLHVYRAGPDPKSSGKGATDIQARASGLCEAIERYSGVFCGDEPRRSASMTDLGADAIHPNDCMRFSQHQYEHRSTTNRRTTNVRLTVPEPFDPGERIEWTPVWSLTREQVRWLPTAWCFFAYPASPSERTCISCSNGNAAGNTLEEAMLQGFLELVERDAVALWWYNQLRRPSVDLDAFGEQYVDDLIAYVRKAGRDLWVLDVTSDFGIPVFVAASGAGDLGGEDVVLGFGAHLDARIALLRAVTEVNQRLVGVMGHPSEPARPPRPAETPTEWGSEVLDVKQFPHLAPSGDATSVVAADGWPSTGDISDDLLICKRLVEERGMELLALDQTRPDIGLPVVKVIVPGLRHFWRRLGPGRLYDVPVEMGWLTEPLAEADLCPIPPPS